MSLAHDFQSHDPGIGAGIDTVWRVLGGAAGNAFRCSSSSLWSAAPWWCFTRPLYTTLRDTIRAAVLPSVSPLA
jgi:hypothetical protein